MKPGLDIFCAWGDGPDVGINLKAPAMRVLGGDLVVVDLTADEALVAAELLRAAAHAAKKLEQECREHDESATVAVRVHDLEPTAAVQTEPDGVDGVVLVRR